MDEETVILYRKDRIIERIAFLFMENDKNFGISCALSPNVV